MSSRRQKRLEKAGQLSMFERFSPYEKSPAPETSKAAAESLDDDELNRLEQLVYDTIAASKDGCTDDEIEVATSLTHQCASARRRGLVLKNRVMDSGRRRATRSGRKAAVWVVRKDTDE